MKFLFPGFLLALCSVLVPVIIHLFNLRKFKKVYFSNVSFLKEIQQQTASTRKLKNLLVLATRILAIIFLVLAFARPYIPTADSPSAFKDNVVSVYIDNSYSMETLNREGSLLDEAKRRAKEIVSAHGINDRFQLLTNDFEGRHQRLMSREEFLNAVEDVKVSGINRNIKDIIDRQQELLNDELNSKRTIYLVSDFQKNMRGVAPPEPDTSIDLRLVRLKATAQPNISVDSVWFLSPVHRAGESEKLVIQLRNNSDKSVENVPIKLKVDHQQRAISSLSLAARSTQKDTLSFSGLTPGWKRGELLITDYPIVFDDRFFFTFNVKAGMDILAINGAGENNYLKAVYQSDPFFRLTQTNSGSINYSNLASYPLVILNSVNDISPGLAQQLSAYVQNGGNLMVFPSLEENLSGLKILSSALGLDQPEALINQEQRVIKANLQHPLFKGVFEQLPRNMDLPVTKKYIQYARQSRTTKQSLLELPSQRLFFAQYSSGNGRVYLSAVSLNEESGNFVRHSLFVPVMFQTAFLSLRDSRLFYTIGKDQFLESPKITLSKNQSLRLRKDEFEAIPDLRQTESVSRIFISDQVRDQGIYSLFKGDSLLANYAFNDNRAESDLSYLSPSDLEGMLPKGKVKVFDPGKESLQSSIKAVNNGVQLWKLCIILALVFLAVEILIVRFYKRAEIS